MLNQKLLRKFKPENERSPSPHRQQPPKPMQPIPEPAPPPPAEDLDPEDRKSILDHVAEHLE